MTDIGEPWTTSVPSQHTRDPCLAHGMVASSESAHPPRLIAPPSMLDSKSGPLMAKQHKIMWTPEMENTALELYVRAVQDGKRSENGFVPDTHRSIARRLNDLFPNVDLDEKKVKSKYNQVGPPNEESTCFYPYSYAHVCLYSGLQKGLRHSESTEICTRV